MSLTFLNGWENHLNFLQCSIDFIDFAEVLTTIYE